MALEAHPPPPAAVIASLLGTAVAVAAGRVRISFPAVFFLLAACLVQGARAHRRGVNLARVPCPLRSIAERIVRTLTFWLRPQFVLRVVNRFQKVAGFDRSIALASSALTAIIPLAIVASAVVSQLGGKDTADRIIDR